MITVLEYSRSKKDVGAVDFSRWKPGKGVSWIDCVNPAAKDFENLSKKAGIPVEDLKDTIDPSTRPKAYSSREYSSFTFQGASGKPERMGKSNIGIFLFKNYFITIREKEFEGISRVMKLSGPYIKNLFSGGVPYFVYRILDELTQDYFSALEKVEVNVDKIEDEVVGEPSKVVIQQIFFQKRMLIYMHKELSSNRDIVSSLEKRYISSFKKEDLEPFHDLYSDIVQLLEHISTYRDVLTSILDMYLSSVSNNLNKIMKTLTLISAFVMVPTLISGIYGMNFIHMPELSWRLGYPFALGLMLFSVVLLYFYFNRRGWIGWP